MGECGFWIGMGLAFAGMSIGYGLSNIVIVIRRAK